MSRHLTSSMLDPYLARTLDAADLRVLDDHVVGCLSCALAVEAYGLDEARWERRGPLGRLVRAEPRPAEALRDADRIQRAA